MKYINLLILFLFLGCGEDAAEKKVRLHLEKEQQKELKKESDKAQLIKYYNPVIGWDSTNVFTYWYQENLCGEQTKTFFEGTIKDIIKIDSSNYAVKIYKKVSKYDISFLINCRISQDQKTKIEKQIKNDVSFFIIKVDTVKTYSPVIISDKSFNGDYYTNFDFDTKLIIFDGLLIDFRLYEE